MYSGERERREGGGVRWGRVRGGGGERDLSSVMPGITAVSVRWGITAVAHVQEEARLGDYGV